MPDLLSQNIDLPKNIALRMPTVTCFKKDGVYYARKYDGTLISSSTTAETVLSAALANKGVVYLAHSRGDSTEFTQWNFSGSLGDPGFTIGGNTWLISDSKDVFLQVPNGYTGTLFRIDSDVEADEVGMRGFSMEEQGSATYSYKAIKFQINGSNSMIFTRFSDLFIYSADTAIELETSNSRWINGNLFDNINIYNPKVGVLFDQQSGQISENTFNSVNIQSKTAVTTNGFKDVNGRGNMFMNCKVWDLDTTGTECNIKSTADGTVIIGGRMTGTSGSFVNQGIKTLILDSGGTNIINVSTTPDVARYGIYHADSNTNAEGFLDGRCSEILVGAGPPTSAQTNDGTGIYRTYDTSATINNLGGFRNNLAQMRRDLNPYFKTAIYLNSVSNVRVFAGFVASSSAPASSADPLNAKEGIALWLDSAVSADFKLMHNDSSGASAVDALSPAVTAATATLYPVEIYGIANSGKFRFVFNGVSTDVSSNIPAASTSLAFWVYMENTTAASRTFRMYYAIVRTDK